MGLFADLANLGNKAAFPGSGNGRALWEEVFGSAGRSKEEAPDGRQRQKPYPGGSYGRSVVQSNASAARLLDALRSKAPGGWTDNRLAQTTSYTGLPYVAIERIAKMMSMAEFKVYRRDDHHPDGKRPIERHDPPEGDRYVKPWALVELLEKPNNQDSFGLLLYQWTQQLKLTGLGLTWMVPNRLGTPMELYPIPTALAIPQPCVNPDFPQGYYRIQPLYPYGPFSSYPTPATAVGAAIPAQWMLRFRYPHPLLRYDGYSPMTGMRLHIDEVEMMDRSRHYKMRRSSNPDAVLNLDDMEGQQPLPEEEIDRIHAEWENEYQGPENHGKLIVGTPGAKLEPWGGDNPKDMDYTNGWSQLAAFVLGGGFGITKPAAGMVEDSSYSTLFATLKQLHLITLEPDCNQIANDLTRHLASFFGDDLIIEITCKRIDDPEIMERKLRLLLDAKALTVNQLLHALEMPIVKADWGNERIGQEQQPPGMMPGPGGVLQELPMKPPGQEKPVEARAEPPDVMNSRPTPGPLGRGSLGPRKNLVVATKSLSFYDRVLQNIENGNGKH